MNRPTMPRLFAGDRSVACVVTCLAIALAPVACSSPPARFYSLVPLAEQGSPPASTDGPLVGVEIVHIPDLVDRPQFVTSLSEYERRIDEYARWAEPLAAHITGVLAANLSSLLSPATVMVEPGRDGRTAAVVVRVEILNFDARVGGDAVLSAQWSVGGPAAGAAPFAEARGAWKSPVEGADPALLAAAMSRNLLELSKELAETLAHHPTR